MVQRFIFSLLLIMSFIHTNFFRFSLPIILTAMVLTGNTNVTFLVEANPGVVNQLPYLLFGISLILCQFFNQGRMGMIALAMTVAYYVIQERLQVPLSAGTTKLEFSLLAFVLPVACIIVYAFPEKRIFSMAGLAYIALLLFLCGWSIFTVRHFQETGLEQLWEGYLFSVPEISRLPFLVVLYSIFIVCAAGIAVLKKNRALDVAVYSCLLLSTLTFALFQQPYISSVLFSLAGILLITGIITTSHELAYLDQLTGIPGRRALETEMTHLGRKFTIAMLDVDHFKKFNDTHGHDIGDDVLKLVASKMTHIGGRAKVYRYGGEEFTVLFKGKDANDASEYLEELRKSIADYEMVLRDQPHRPKNNKTGSRKRRNTTKTHTVSVTISIGLADSSEIKKPQQIIKAADQALYRAKKAGRNRVSL